jgi:hypothetical protein
MPEDNPPQNRDKAGTNALTDQPARTSVVGEESGFATATAIVSIVYLLVALVLLFVALFDIWIGKFDGFGWSWLLGSGDPYKARLILPAFRLLAYAVIGGAMGGVVNGIRSFISWHCDAGGFGPRYIWKYVAAPFLGGTLALIISALVHGGIGALGANITTGTPGVGRGLVMLGIGALSGYGARDAFTWLDAQVTKVFAVKQEGTPTAPDPLPKITKQPQDASSPAGQPATFTIVASGVDQLRYQWQKIAPGQPETAAANIQGATSSSYTTPAAAPADNHTQFLCIVSAAGGTVTSATATLTVT